MDGTPAELLAPYGARLIAKVNRERSVQPNSAFGPTHTFCYSLRSEPTQRAAVFQVSDWSDWWWAGPWSRSLVLMLGDGGASPPPPRRLRSEIHKFEAKIHKNFSSYSV